MKYTIYLIVKHTGLQYSRFKSRSCKCRLWHSPFPFLLLFQFKIRNNLQKRYSESDFVMKVAWKIALYDLVFHQLPLIQHCSIFYQKMIFRVPNILGEFNGKICSECISCNLEFQNFPGDDPPPPHTYRRERGMGSPQIAHAVIGLCLGHSTLPLLSKLRLLLQFFLRTS